HIIGSDISNHEDNNENNHREYKVHVEENKPKRSNDVEPTLHPNKILTALIANDNGQLIS
ncbi:unnamed protein product, partial [Rotaria sordida]